MAAHNPPGLVFAVARERGLWSLANAFLQPVRPRRDGDLMGQSAKALDRHWGQLSAMYGQSSIAGMWVAMLDGEQQLEHLGSARQTNLQAVGQGVLDAASFVHP
jgi:CRISPR system Cascade subunit CasC